MRAIKARLPRPPAQTLKFPDNSATAANPTLSDVMRQLGEIKANQVQILTLLNMIAHNQPLAAYLSVLVAEALALVTAPNAVGVIESDLSAVSNDWRSS